MKMNKFLFISLSIFFLIFLYVSIFNSYKIRIQIDLDNISTFDIEQNLSSDLRKEILKIKEIKEAVVFSKRNSCNIYLKLYPFVLKNNVISKIQTVFSFLSTPSLKNTKITFDYDFDARYDLILVFHGELINYQELVLEHIM